ncbi:MAG: PAS domain S-box protein [Bacteroidota bacterium]
MNTEALVTLAATIIKVSLGIMVFLRNPRDPVNRRWLVFVAFLGLWGFGDFGIHLHKDKEAAEAFLDLAAIGVTFFPGAFLHFALVLTGRWAGKLRLPTLIGIYAVSAALCILAFHGSIIQIVSHNGVLTTGHGTSYHLIFFWIVLCLCTGLFFCFLRFLNTNSKSERAESFLLFLGLAIPIVAGIVADSIELPQFVRPLYVTTTSSVVGVAIASFVLVRLQTLTPRQEVVAEKVLEAAGDLVCVINVQGYLTFATGLFRQVLGIAPERPLGAVHVKDFVVEYEQVYAMLSEKQHKREPNVVEFQYRSGTGKQFPVSVSVTRMLEKGRSTRFVFIARDISERRELARLVEESKEKYREIVEGSLDGMVVIQEGRLIFVNEAAVRIFGYSSAGEMLSIRFEETVAPGSRSFFPKDLERAAVGENIFRNYEMKGLTRAGKIIDLEINARLISWNGKPAVQSSLRDITERKALEREQAMWFWEQESLMTIDRQLVAMVDLTKLLNAVTNHARAFTRADYSGVILINEDRQSYAWRGIRGNIHPVPTDFMPLKELPQSLMEQKGPIQFYDVDPETGMSVRNFPALENENLVIIAGFPFHIKEDLEGVLLVGFRKEHDFSDREIRLLNSLAEKSAIAITNAELYENLRQREQELGQLSSARAAAQEDERRRIAREIHDGLGQMLTAVKFNVEILEDFPGLGEAEKKRFEEIKGLLDNVMTEARDISYNLMPSVLEDFGLSPALQLFCETFANRLKVKVSYQAHGINGRFDDALEVNLYRIAQEALTNIVKHAEASTIEVQLLGNDQGVRMSIEDDGKGFFPLMPRTPSSEGGMGILSMRERAAAFGGTLTIESAPGKGTTILVDIPKKGIVDAGH